MAQPSEPAAPAAVAHSCYRDLYADANFQAGEPGAAQLLSSYRYTEAAGGGERPTLASLKEQTLALSDRRSLTFLCLMRTAGTGVDVRILHKVMRYYALPAASSWGWGPR